MTGVTFGGLQNPRAFGHRQLHKCIGCGTHFWGFMLTAVGWQSNKNKVLKSQSGWSENGNGSDSSGFSALPAGYYNGSFEHVGDEANFWSSFDHYRDYTYKLTLDNNMKCDKGCINDENKNVGNSVRCVKN